MEHNFNSTKSITPAVLLIDSHLTYGRRSWETKPRGVEPKKEKPAQIVLAGFTQSFQNLLFHNNSMIRKLILLPNL